MSGGDDHPHGKGHFWRSYTWACPVLPAVAIVNLIHYVVAAMSPLAISLL